MSNNEKFTHIFLHAYRLLEPGGELVIGSCYLDNDATRRKQEAFYSKAGMTIITHANDSFTATKERFWSQQFTEQKILNYLGGIHPDNFLFTPLDTYAYAMQVRIKSNVK